MLSLPHMQKRQNGLPWTETSHTRIWTSIHWFLLAGRQFLHPLLFLFQTELGHWLYLLATFFSMIALKSWRNQSLQLLYQHQPQSRLQKCVKDACLLQCKSKEEPVVTLGAVTRRQEVCFVCYSSSQSLVVSFLLGSEKTLFLMRKVAEWLW